MANPTPSERPQPWHAVSGGTPARESVAPSKPAMPSTGQIPVVPQPIEAEDADVVAPVASPPDEEIMPSARGTVWSADPPPAAAEPAAGSASDPVRDLGDAAVRNASLSASGAHTPLGGVPQVPSSAASAPSSPGAAAPTTAWFMGDPRENAPEGAAEWSAGTVDRPEPESEPAAVPPPNIPELEDDEPAYTPRFGVPLAAHAGPGDSVEDTEPDGAGSGGGDEPPAQPHERTPWWRSVPFLVVVGLLVMGGIGYGLFLLLAPEAETVELTPEVIVEAPAEPALDPIEIEEPTDFQAALPSVVGPYALTAIDSPAPQAAGLEVRAAEVDDLTYSDGEVELSLRAIQHYDAEAATAQFEALAVDATARESVMAGDTPVGERASVSGEDGDSILWRNGSAVFVLTGPADALEDFYALYPL
ncbi:hypothetical protein [Demequina activiva]|uniref:Uncharacterized protein n=1 Tax=Demequina activiva TaxID=1582364 RepID=A0A919UH32_9MICO|nr:hypothetical protein [Demequina activiva]GIG55014.1 hypothetical protein Dac01nite_17660 [Demequina activiva]